MILTEGVIKGVMNGVLGPFVHGKLQNLPHNPFNAGYWLVLPRHVLSQPRGSQNTWDIVG